MPTVQFYRPPADKPASVKALSETADERVEMREFRYTRMKVTQRKAADGDWTTTARNPDAPRPLRHAPQGNPKTTRTLIDKTRSNSFPTWLAMGSPQSLTA